jgi:hypothetical protein
MQVKMGQQRDVQRGKRLKIPPDLVIQGHRLEVNRLRHQGQN